MSSYHICFSSHLVIMKDQGWQGMHKSVMFVNLFFLSLLLLFTLLYLFKFFKREKLNLPPSPPKFPLIGNLHQLGPVLHKSLHTLSAKYGPVMLLHLGRIPTLIVSSADATREMLKNQDVAFSDRPQLRAADALFLGCTDVAFSAYGEYWRRVKKICVLELLSQKRVQAFQFVREEEVAKLVEKVRELCPNKAVVDLSDMLLTTTNDILSRSVLGRVYEKDGEKSFGALSRTAIDLIGTFSFKDMFPSLGWMDNLTGLVFRLKSTAKALHDFLDKVIEEHETLNSTADQDNTGRKDIVDILLHLQKNGEELTRDNIKAILMDMFVGATDTSSAVMEWGMAELVKNPIAMKEAQEEVRRVVGQKEKLTEADIDEMVYLKCVVKETLRLHSPALMLRETCASAKLEGYDIPPKTRVLINAWSIQRDPEVWERPEEFIPERFANSLVDFKGQDSQFIPFGGGRRVCPGIAFGVANVELVLANLLYWFEWELPNGMNAQDMDISESDGPIVHKKTPLLLVPVMHST